MKLSINVIFYELKESFESATLQKKSLYDNIMSFHAPFWQTDVVKLASDRIFVMNSSDLPADISVTGQCLLVMPDCPQRLASKKGISVITVPGASTAQLFNAVLAIFDRYSEWDYSLQSLIFQNATLDDLLKASFPIIGNSLSVHNNNFKYIARYGDTPGQDDLSNMDRSDFFDPDYLLKVDEASPDSVFYSKNVIPFQDSHSHKEYFFLNLFSGNTAAGRLVVINDHRPFRPQDGVLVEHLGKYLETALAYVSYPGSGKNLRRDSLLEFISGKTHSDDKILHLKTVSPFSRLADDQRLYCMVCDMRSSELSEQYISFQLEHFLPESVCVLYEGRLVLLCANQSGQSQKDFFDEATQLFQRFNLIAGCCNPFTDFYDFKFCYRQAIFTLQQVLSDPAAPALNFFKDHTLEHILKFGTSVLPVRLLCADCVLKMAQHDSTASVSYCESLGTYLDTGGNMAETAKLLGVTRNTFLARLERIMRFVDLDLDDRDSRLYLQISLRMIRG